MPAPDITWPPFTPPSLAPGLDPYPFGRFNNSAQNYTGPVFANLEYHGISTYISELKTACANVIGPGNQKWVYLVAECVSRNLNKQQKASIATFAYALTLWPAFIALFASLGPDASDAAYDSVPWAWLLALTSGGMTGFRAPLNVPHHVRVFSLEAGRAICISGESAVPTLLVNKVGRFSPRRKKPSRAFSHGQWVVLVLSYASWGAFLALFLHGLSQSFYFTQAQVVTWAQAGVWFYMAGSPAIGEALARLVFNNIELYEPVDESDFLQTDLGKPPISRWRSGASVATGVEHSLTLSALGSPTAAISGPTAGSSREQPPYARVENRTAFSIWCRIIWLQLTGQPYRVLVKPFPTHWFVDLYEWAVQMGRFVLLVVGSIQQASYGMYPIELIYPQSAVLVFSTTSPRILWPKYWMRDRRGADLVVFCQRALAEDLGDLLTP